MKANLYQRRADSDRCFFDTRTKVKIGEKVPKRLLKLEALVEEWPKTAGGRKIDQR
jgi:hypothetical protein